MEEIVLNDIREMAQRIVIDEKAIREDFIRHNAELADKAIKSAKKELQGKRNRIEELSRLMQLAYSDSTVTLKVYSHFIPDTQGIAVNALNRLTE